MSDAQGNSSFQQLGFEQAFVRQRWQLQFFDQFTYLPVSQFGFGGASNLGVPGVGGVLAPLPPGLGGNYVPNQTVSFAVGSRYSNSFTTQTVYTVSPHSSFTFSGSYGVLSFTQSGNLDNSDVIASIGYNYAISKQDTLGMSYQFTAYHFTGLPQAFGYHVVSLAYGRKITGRLALQLFGGPSVVAFRVPVNNTTSYTSGTAGATLSYAYRQGSLSLTYNHGVTGGAGVLVGSNLDQVNFALTRRISRQWDGKASFGFASNRPLSTGIPQNVDSYNFSFITAALSRPIGRNASLVLGYTLYIDGTIKSGCTTGPCSNTYTQNQIAIGVQWHTRPYILR